MMATWRALEGSRRVCRPKLRTQILNAATRYVERPDKERGERQGQVRGMTSKDGRFQELEPSMANVELRGLEARSRTYRYKKMTSVTMELSLTTAMVTEVTSL